MPSQRDLMSVTWTGMQFNRVLARYLKRFDGRVWDVLRKVAFDVIAGTAKLTPVDTGRCRAAWVAFLETGGVSAPVAGRNVTQEAIADGKKSASWKFNKSGQEIRVVNGVHYVVFLEFGSSKQARDGMLRKTMNQFRVKLQAHMRKAP